MPTLSEPSLVRSLLLLGSHVSPLAHRSSDIEHGASLLRWSLPLRDNDACTTFEEGESSLVSYGVPFLCPSQLPVP
jgi:hypothetical protein